MTVNTIRPRYIIQLIIVEAALGWFFFILPVDWRSWERWAFLKHYLGWVLLHRHRVCFWRHESAGPGLYLSGYFAHCFYFRSIGILQHWRILPLLIRLVGTVLSKINGMGKLESFNAVSTLVLGQSENFIAYKGILADIPPKRLYTMAATAMSTVSLSIVGAYMSMIEARYVVAALLLNMFSTFIILSIINPGKESEEQPVALDKLHEEQSFFEMLGEYILAGFKVAMIILAMLIGFIALIAAVNALFAALFGYSFQQLLGYVFYPFAWLIGIPAVDALQAGSIMATKLVAMNSSHDRTEESGGRHDAAWIRHPVGIPGLVC